MANLLVIKDRLVTSFSRFEAYIVPILKFVLTLIAMLFINSNIGFMSKLKSGLVVFVVSLLCAFLPGNFIVIVLGIVVILHMYALSLEVAVVFLLAFMIMFVVFLRFTPKDALTIVFTPICFALKIPYAVPLTLGFVGSPLSCIGVVCGVVSYYMIDYAKENADSFAALSTDPESALSGFKHIIDTLLGGDELLLMCITFALIVICVFMVKNLPVDYSWKIALGLGAAVNILIILIGCTALEVDLSIGGMIVGTIVSVIIVLVIQFFIFNVDYSRTESVQFEDDEYYYYVKAIPKMSVEAPNVEVKHINPRY